LRSTPAAQGARPGRASRAVTRQREHCTGSPIGADRPFLIDTYRILVKADETRAWFEQSVSGLRGQIDDSAGYVVFPGVAQWGILIGGGRYERGALYRAGGAHIGWAGISTPSIGLQAGVRGFRMLMVLENEAVLQRFRADQLDGSVSGVVVAGNVGGSGKAPFQNGVVIYEAANEGLMAGVNIGLNWIQYQPLE
jgi:lipid-binding SYLF domain-containing protein